MKFGKIIVTWFYESNYDKETYEQFTIVLYNRIHSVWQEKIDDIIKSTHSIKNNLDLITTDGPPSNQRLNLSIHWSYK